MRFFPFLRDALAATARWIGAQAFLCGAFVLTAFLVWLTFLQRYGWPSGHEDKQLDHLFWSFVIVAGLLGLILAAHLKVNARVSGPGGFSASIDGDQDGKNDTGQGG